MLMILFLVGCLGYPKSITPVRNFNIKKYSGKWYEIARTDNRFERGLVKVTAEYILRDDGGVKVINRGFDAESKQWKRVEGKAYFVERNDEGYLKVSFFGPFYSSYVVFFLEENYEYAFVCGSSEKYLWLLSRKPTVDEAVVSKFVSFAEESGFETDSLIFPSQ